MLRLLCLVKLQRQLALFASGGILMQNAGSNCAIHTFHCGFIGIGSLRAALSNSSVKLLDRSFQRRFLRLISSCIDFG